MKKIFQIDDYRYSKTNSKWERGKCPHKQLVLDDHGQTVECGDCGKELGAYWALSKMVHKWADWQRQLQARADEVKEMEGAVVVLKAAKSVETAWRRRKTVPCCPHCKAAILPEDGFGDRLLTVSKDLERQRRKRLKAKAK